MSTSVLRKWMNTGQPYYNKNLVWIDTCMRLIPILKTWKEMFALSVYFPWLRSGRYERLPVIISSTQTAFASVWNKRHKYVQFVNETWPFVVEKKQNYSFWYFIDLEKESGRRLAYQLLALDALITAKLQYDLEGNYCKCLDVLFHLHLFLSVCLLCQNYLEVPTKCLVYIMLLFILVCNAGQRNCQDASSANNKCHL